MAEQNLDQILAQVLDQMQDHTPELVAILNEAKQQGLSEWDTFERLGSHLKEHPEVSEALMAALNERPPRMTRSEHGMPRLNPLVEAALLERIQYDQDAPELRSGPAPKLVRPAVPVDTHSRNPVAIGHMLKSAATSTRKKLNKLDRERQALADDVIAGKADALAIIARHGELVAQQDPQRQAEMILFGTQETDLPGYRRGELPAIVKTKSPSGSQLAKLNLKAQQENAWLFLSTSHGRRSAVPAIREIVAEQLKKRGLKVTEREFKPGTKLEPLLAHEWRLQLTGKNSIQPTTSVIDLSARALAAGLIRDLPNAEQPLSEVFLEVTPIDQFSDHQVGWAARLFSGD